MRCTADHDELARWAMQALSAPIRPDRALLDFLETTLGTRDPSVLLSDEDSSETASILELLFYPDRRLRIDFEGRWGDRPFSGSQAAALVDRLMKGSSTAVLRLDKPARTIPLKVPDFAVASFVERLKITWAPPAGLLEALRTKLSPDHLIEVRARLRQARVEWHVAQVQLIERFLTRIPTASDDFDDGLEFLLSIIADLGPADGPFDFLTAKKLFFFQSLCQYEAFERRRRASNMEILMLQGARAAHGDVEQWRTGMRLVDRICTALYGSTRFFQRPVDHYGETSARIGDAALFG